MRHRNERIELRLRGNVGWNRIGRSLLTDPAAGAPPAPVATPRRSDRCRPRDVQRLDQEVRGRLQRLHRNASAEQIQSDPANDQLDRLRRRAALRGYPNPARRARSALRASERSTVPKTNLSNRNENDPV